MKTVTTAVCAEAAAPRLASAARARVADYLELTKPRIAVMVLFTVLIGAVLGSRDDIDVIALVNVALGTLLVAGGASALNQVVERANDACMRRTENRPLPSGRLQPVEALAFGVALAVLGEIYLLTTLPTPWAALVALGTLLSYVLVYTPLKRVTPLNTLVGAVPGALPPLIGWAAVRNSLDAEAVTLFLIIFLWQVPHFLAIAWIYRDDYARGGFRMLPAVDPKGRLTGWNMVVYCLALIPASQLPFLAGRSGWFYAAGALLLGLGFLASTVPFVREASASGARRVMRGSLLYLPAVLTLLLVDGLVRRF